MKFFSSSSYYVGLLAQNKLLTALTKIPYETKYECNTNFIEIRRNKTKPLKEQKTLLLMHGFGSGLGFFFQNYEELSKGFDRIIAADWIGMGLSSRTAVDFKGQTSLFSVICTTEEKEKIVSRNMTNLFIDSLEMFRESQQIENFVLAGHSLGGFLAGKYALKYPKHISSLVLISPVGVPAQPPKDEHMDMNSMDWRIRVAKNLWKMNFTPQSLIRLTGSRGPNLVKPILNRRFSSRWNDEELQLITDYFYQISIAPSSGELGLNALLEPIFLKVKDDLVTSASDSNSGKPRRVSRGGVYAKEPLEQEMVNLDKRIPVLVLYGDNDWLYYPTVEDTMRLWRSHGLNAKYITVSNAGHHLYIENSDHFNKVVLDWANAAYTNK